MSRRLALAYAALFATGVTLAATSFAVGSGRHAPPKLAGVYRSPGSCTGGRELTLRQSGQFVDASGGLSGSLRYQDGLLRGRVRCATGSSATVRLRHEGTETTATGLGGSLGGRAFRAAFVRDVPKPGQAVAGAQPSAEVVFGRLMLAIAAVMLAARLVRALIGRLGQPPVMGEVLAGILLGPTLLGHVWPGLQSYLFPPSVVPLLTAGADIGLAFYMFLVGLDLDPRLLRGRLAHAAAISNGSIVLPLGLGILVALPLYPLLGTPGKPFDAFALFLGVAMAITAFPVLARILIERRLLDRPAGALALSAAAVDDVTAWGLLAIASGIAGRGSALAALPVLGYVFAFCAAMALIARPLLRRAATAYDEAGSVPAGWITAIFVGVLLSAYVSMKSGVAPIFGAFVMGLVMPRRADLSHDVTRRLEDFVGTVLLPLFFVVTGLKTDVGLLDRPLLWGLTLVLLAVAIAGKWLGAMLMARAAGYGARESSVIGALMNTRGLTELIVLNVGLELGVISGALFTMLVLVALVTTFMTAPAIRLLDPHGTLTADDEEEPARAAGALVVAALEAGNLPGLLALAEPLARADAGRGLVLVRALEPPPVGAALAARERELTAAGRELEVLAASLEARGVPARLVTFTSAHRADDLARLVLRERAGLLLVDGRRSLLGPGIPRGELARLLDRARCEVAVLVDRARAPRLGDGHGIVVVSGESGHDEAALQVGARLAEAAGTSLRPVAPEALAGAAGGAGVVVAGLAPSRRRPGALGAARGALAAAGGTATLLVQAAPAE